MKNSNIPSGRGIILSGNRQRAGTYLGIARRKMHDMKMMMRIGKLSMMQRRYYLDRDCVWVHLLSIGGADFIRIHSCSEGGGCSNEFIQVFVEQFPEAPEIIRTSFWNAHKDEGEDVPFVNRIFGFYDFGDQQSVTISRTHRARTHNYALEGDYTVKLTSFKRLPAGTPNDTFTTGSSSEIVLPIITKSIPEMDGLNKYLCTFSALTINGYTRDDVSLEVNGVDVTSDMLTNQSTPGRAIRFFFVTDGNIPTATLRRNDGQSVGFWVTGVTLSAIKFKCIASFTQEITAPGTNLHTFDGGEERPVPPA